MGFDISKFDEYRENNRLEVKKADSGLPSSMWDTYSSFANSYGGVLLLGVGERQDGSFYTTGLKNEQKLIKNFWNTINDRKKVSKNILVESDLQTYEVNGDVVLAIHVPKARREDKPIYLNDDIFGKTFRRNGEGDYRCTREEVLAMIRDQTEETPDMRILENFGMDVLNKETVHAYRQRHNAARPTHVWGNLDDDAYLERIGAAKVSDNDGKYHPTAAGLLMFGEEYKILYIYPEYFLDYREMLDPTIRWTDRVQSESGDWTGNLFDFFFRIYPKITRDLKIPFKTDGLTRIEDTPVHKAIREALANCFDNADFFVKRGIVIKKDPDRTILTLPFTKRAIKASDKNKRQKQATKTSENEKTLNNKKKILEYMTGKDEVSTKELAEILELSSARTRVIIKELCNDNKIIPLGEKRNRRYKLKG